MKHSLSLLMGAAAPFAAIVDAHTIFTTLFVDEKNQGDGTCVRMNMNANSCTNPISSLSSDDMACGVSGATPVAFTCPASAGGKLTFEWRAWADLEQTGSIDISHKGPCAVYAKQITGTMASSTAAGPGWFKIWDEGYDATTKKWCTEKLIDNNGLMSINIPSALPAGNYLFRPELLALHNANIGDPQFYTGCAQVFVQSSVTGTLNVPSEYSVSIPGHVKAGEASVSFNIYTPTFPYTMPGPKVFVPGTTTARRAALVQTEGLIPGTCLCKNANWCGVEVPSYSNEAGCWAASNDCYTQVQTCYDTSPPTGSANCQAWESKCQGIQDACSAGKFSGPPNKGVKLASKDAAVPGAIPAAANAGTSGSSGSSSSGAVTAKKIESTTTTSTVAKATSTSSKSSSSSSASSSSIKAASPSTSAGSAKDKSTSTTSASNSTKTLTVSPDGSCGGSAGYTCKKSEFGKCCSQYGYCGSSRPYCGRGNQAAYSG